MPSIIQSIRQQHKDLVKGFLPALRRARIARHIPQAALAAQLGVSKQAVNNWEAGRYVPAPRMFRRWLDIFGI
jgi:transcriptional regulator with XRE-family HTH domain